VKDEGITAKQEAKIVKEDPVIEAEDVAMRDASAKEDVSTPVKTESPTQTKKRSVEKDDDAVSAAEDSEPPAKRTKTKVSSTKQVNGKGSKKQAKTTTPKPSPKIKEEEKSTPVATKKPRGQSKRKVIEEDDEDEEVAAPISTKLPQKDVKDPEGSPVEPKKDISDEESEVESEDEKPEVVAKKREKVQATLKAVTKDPYPDWKAGDPVPYAALCTTFSKIEMTTKRLEIAAHCSLFLRQVMRLTPDDLLPTVLLMINKLAADYAGIELGIGESLIMKAIGESTGRTLAMIKSDQKEIGDLGLVAAKSRANQGTMFKPKALTVRSVHKSLLDIAVMSGSGAQGQKVSGIKKLLSAADAAGVGKGKVDITENKGGPSESKFIVRMLEGKLRLGLADKSVLISLAQAIVFHEASQKDKVPSSEQLAEGESILKSVYRYASALYCPMITANRHQRTAQLRSHHSSNTRTRSRWPT
jgi:DNA ligase-1